ncbi:MAG TPA: oxygen-independent coproporphyrinogen III oxidase [Steroidobacteraceae bacterium]|nr:oxygen-independent coproporphyrinogen III oxidase [Steroidobacteraceae bacterium]
MNAAERSAKLAKYDVAGPRYTSYPTVPYWDATPDEAQWLAHLRAALGAGGSPGASIYVHVPFCRALCTFCGCNTRVTRTHAIIMPYVQAVLAELALYRERLDGAPLELGELHLGGGTPTFLDPPELDALLAGILGAVTLHPEARLSIEVDPRVTTPEQLRLLAQHGFRRISLGVQDFDPAVQDIVNRVQSVAQVRAVTEEARRLGFDSVNYDLIYGLPLQTRASIELTMSEVCALKPDRIALYGYAHVPWIKPGQRRFTEVDLPEGRDKRALYEHARERLEAAGYREVGLDHFALPTDSLWLAARAGTLHRNFMGYTEAFTRPLLGLGASAIGDAVDAFVQNEKELQQYHERIARRELPIQRGHVLDAEDQVLRRHILNLMTRMETRWTGADATPFLDDIATRLATFANDGLVELEAHGCRVTEAGRGFLRNICMAFDARLARASPERPLFSQTA